MTVYSKIDQKFQLFKPILLYYRMKYHILTFFWVLSYILKGLVLVTALGVGLGLGLGLVLGLGDRGLVWVWVWSG